MPNCKPTASASPASGSNVYVARLLRENRLRPPRRQTRPPITTDSRHGDGIAPNLLQRAFEADRPNTIWLADITYVVTDEGWLYLAAVKDMATREIVGWSMADHLRRSLCEKAVLCISRHQHQLVRPWQHEDHSPLFSREYKSWPNRMLLLP
jgi:transposase InsO family protein